MQRRRSGAAAAAVMVLHNRQGWVAVAGGPFGLRWTLRGERAKLQRDSLTPVVPKVPTLLMHYADREGRESDDSDEGGKEGFLIGERLTGQGGGCGRGRTISFIASIRDASAGRAHDVIFYRTYSSLLGSRHEEHGQVTPHV